MPKWTVKNPPNMVYKNRNWLYNKYWKEGKCRREIAEETGVSTGTIQYWIEKLKVPQRTTSESLIGKRNGHYKSGKFVDSNGVYILSRGHPNCTKTGYVYKHRIVMEKHLGRFLNKNEYVHHINFINTDNRIKNLTLCKGHGEHRLIEKSLYDCVDKLLQNGTLKFNKETNRYEVSDK